MASKVYFSTLKCDNDVSPLSKIKKLAERCGIRNIFTKKELIAVKVHFGELGNTAFLRPVYLRPVLEILREMETNPYLTDTNTLYLGMRTNSVDHLHNAALNGFNYSTLQAPIIIADGLRGESNISVEVNLKLLKSVNLAADIVNADGMVVVSHFKGHEVSGFGGAIKNVSMGCASRQGKMEMHSATRPTIKEDNCTGCATCAEHCFSEAIEVSEKAFITDKCVGCAKCIALCPEGAVKVNWDETTDNVQRKMVEYAYGLVKTLNSKIIYINIITSVSPACDCHPGNDGPITNDIGFLSSTDPIAIDKASFDLIKKSLKDDGDPFKRIYDYLDSNIQFRHAEEIGFGSAEYELLEI